MFILIITLGEGKIERMQKMPVPGEEESPGTPWNPNNEYLEERKDDAGKSIPSRHHIDESPQNPA